MNITKFELRWNLDVKHRKNKNFTDEYAVINLESNQKPSVLLVRFYATNMTTYCCIWGDKFSGSEKSTGYGYHTESDAFYKALKQCGIEFDSPISGYGRGDYHEIMTKIANELGYKNIYIHHAHA